MPLAWEQAWHCELRAGRDPNSFRESQETDRSLVSKEFHPGSLREQVADPTRAALSGRGLMGAQEGQIIMTVQPTLRSTKYRVPV